MGVFDFFKPIDINAGVEEYRNTERAVLLDVRTIEEYREGHIEGSINLPLQAIAGIGNKVPNKNTPVFVHCLSGGRSATAVSALKSMGYSNVTNIGGINRYSGKVVR